MDKVEDSGQERNTKNGLRITERRVRMKDRLTTRMERGVNE